MMPNNQIRKGKANVLPFLKASRYASAKEPIPILQQSRQRMGSLGILEHRLQLIKASSSSPKQSKWPFPADISTIIGKKYKVAVCFNINAKGPDRPAQGIY